MVWYTVTGSYRLRLFQIRMLRKIHVFRPKREEATGDLRKLSSEELYDFYSSKNIDE
jgi:hypothetical protein